MLECFDRSDYRFLLACVLILVAGLTIGLTWFDSAFPEASIEFKVDRGASRRMALEFLAERKIETARHRHGSKFAFDDDAKIFLERTLGLESANVLMKDRVSVWYWQQRWFTPLEVEEVRVRVSPSGRVVSFSHQIPEDEKRGVLKEETAVERGERFLNDLNPGVGEIELISSSVQQRENREDLTLTWQSKTLSPGGAPYKYEIVFLGDELGEYREWLDVPEAWLRSYTELRSRNESAGTVDGVFFVITILLAGAIFVIRLRRGDVQVSYTVWSGVVAAVLVTLTALNSLPTDLANYDTDQSFAAFLTIRILLAVLQGLGIGFFLVVLVGAGDVLYRERFPHQLGIPKLFSRKALRSKRAFKGLVLGYAMFGAFLAYQVIFYLIADKLGAWAPADIPYDDILNTAIPWASVLFIGFFPAMSEEYMSRAFSLPLFEKFFRSKWAAIIVSGFIWGFGHAAYPNQPFYIRGLEVGIAGVVIGLLLYRFGLLPLLVWHYTVDALYTSLLLFQSGNLYYMGTAAAASFVFLLPPLASLWLYKRHGGFEPDHELSNSALPVLPSPEKSDEAHEEIPLEAPIRVTPKLLVPAAMLLVVGGLVGWDTVNDVVDYATSKQDATDIATQHLESLGLEVPEKSITIAAEGFRAWAEGSSREDGGAPGGYSSAAADHIFDESEAPMETLIGIQSSKVEAATWVTRFFTPGEKEEIFVETDPRHPENPGQQSVIGFHRYRDEDGPGPELTRVQAESRARRELARYGLDESGFATREALSFKKPNRFDWLFHFEETVPLAGEAHRRVSVRVAGDSISQVQKTVWIPEGIRKDAERRTALHATLFVIRILSVFAILGLIITGAALHFRAAGLRWKRSVKIALALVPIPIAATLMNIDRVFAQYDTSIQWTTFLVVIFASVLILLLVQSVVLWLALALIDSIVPSAFAHLSREGRSRLGRNAVAVALLGGAMFFVFSRLGTGLPHWLPGLATIDEVSPPAFVTSPLPALDALWQAVSQAILGSAAIASIVALFRYTEEKWRKPLHTAIVVSLVLFAVNSSIDASQLLVEIPMAIAFAAVAYFAIVFILGKNLLAYPVAFFTWSAVTDAAAMLGQSRTDLRINGIVVLIVVAATVLWIAVPGRSANSEE